MNSNNGIDRSKLIEFLLSSASYPHNPSQVRHIQTHASDVFIASPFVYKIKKPVDFGFLDYSTLEKRKFYCEKESELNKKLCCKAYLGVEKIFIKDGVLTLDSGDDVVEYAVKMNLLPEKYFLHKLLIEGKVSDSDYSGIAKRLADYYNTQMPNEEIRGYGKPEIIKSVIDQNLGNTQKYTGYTITPAAYHVIKSYNEKFFRDKSILFKERMDDGWIRNCHGDLRLEHINLSENDICIYDCIEFNNKFRYIDIASDVAFLAMDLDYNGYNKFSGIFITQISRMLEDRKIFSVLDFYKCYRAYVRGKVGSLKALEAEVPEQERAQAQKNAEIYFKLALKYALFGSKPAVIVVFGIIGSGKSTIAKALSEELSFEVISSDEVRKRLSGVPKYERKYDEYNTGIYSKDVTEKTYTEMARIAGDILNNGQSVVLDASFSRENWRNYVNSLTQRFDACIYFIQTHAAKNEIVKRLQARESMEKVVSDGRLEILDRFIDDFNQPLELDQKNLITVDTTAPLSENIQTVLTEILNRSLNQD